jgi:2-keto-4-pentenoate hydratase/2-oxohepta-3-ene-1,7-dioic acid hydratase in catechol pathway
VRIASFDHRGRRSYGVVVDDATIADAGALLGGRDGDVIDVLRSGELDALAEAARRAPLVAIDDVTLRPPLDAPRLFCIGVNYRDHRAEMGHDDVPYPTVFVRFSTSVVGHDSPIVRPSVSDRFDYEGELAVVVGRAGRHIARRDALAHVAGYACFDDGSVRDFQRHTSQFTAGKNFDRSGAFGPWLVTADEVGDPSTLELTTRVNGEVRQHATTDLLINDVPALVEYLSTFTELLPGDVIATGTPGGVGVARDPQVFLRPGDTVEVEISGVGLLRNVVTAEGAAEGERV